MVQRDVGAVRAGQPLVDRQSIVEHRRRLFEAPEAAQGDGKIGILRRGFAVLFAIERDVGGKRLAEQGLGALHVAEFDQQAGKVAGRRDRLGMLQAKLGGACIKQRAAQRQGLRRATLFGQIGGEEAGGGQRLVILAPKQPGVDREQAAPMGLRRLKLALLLQIAGEQPIAKAGDQTVGAVPLGRLVNPTSINLACLAQLAAAFEVDAAVHQIHHFLLVDVQRAGRRRAGGRRVLRKGQRCRGP